MEAFNHSRELCCFPGIFLEGQITKTLRSSFMPIFFNWRLRRGLKKDTHRQPAPS
ncbi:uncharacterized protein LACBIDRAFT_313910 [Laccaria bicolor S238N-H82]|uniref:Predicted protein n=1 Tax=Laccaria bicolor (strain S238N-H82 / ATCC MYA-4686) TaxID=486041 RepID=B0D146_LACBS|nr:uncharacterized protein LACBIDRAFT_313910 [Laccaria bicolor S238N-H82]EDR11936.1 predicted protein [Laccaria bicolor S238N-H82]|eukprot:XP_001877833.1 predicted protein [Laccaria bicolor S238N-H82]